MDKARETLVERLRYRVQNPSAWVAYEDEGSDLCAEAASDLTRLNAKVEELERETDRTAIETQMAIRVEKLLLAKLGREWTPDGISIVSLIDELAAEAQVADLSARLARAVEDSTRLTKERDKERKHVARVMRDLDQVRKRAETAEANLRSPIDLTLVETALSHSSFALDGIVALDDEDAGKDGGSATCQATKKTVDRALKHVRAALSTRSALVLSEQENPHGNG